MADKVDKKIKKAPPAVQMASEWALLTAGMFIAAFALPSWTRLTTDNAEVVACAEETAAAIGRGVAWCTVVVQSVTAALALLLPGSRRPGSRSHRALAYSALAAAAANHVMFASDIAIVITTTAGADSEPWYWIIGGAASFVVMLAAGDLVCFLALIGWLD